MIFSFFVCSKCVRGCVHICVHMYVLVCRAQMLTLYVFFLVISYSYLNFW